MKRVCSLALTVLFALTMIGSLSTQTSAQDVGPAAADGESYSYWAYQTVLDSSHYQTIWNFGASNPYGLTYGDILQVRQLNSGSCRYRIFVRDPTDPDYAYYEEWDNGQGGTLSTAAGNSYDDGYYDTVFGYGIGNVGFGDATQFDLQRRCGSNSVGVSVGVELRHFDPLGDWYECGTQEIFATCY